MLLSKTCTYAIRAALLVTLKDMQEERKFIPIRELADELSLSFHFLTKIMQTLTEVGIMQSFKGPNGGVGLMKSPKEITLYDIVVAIDGEEVFTECVMGLPGCGNFKPCPLHNDWDKRRTSIKQMLTKSSLSEMAKKIDLKQNRM